MTFSDQSYNLRIELDTKGCELTANEIANMEDDLHTLKNQVEDFPISDLHVTVVHHGRGDDYHVKTSLRLPSRTLFTGERDTNVHPAFESCIRKLTKKVRAYKRQMRVGSEATKQAEGTRQEVRPSGQLNLERLVVAQASNDFVEFRHELDVFAESLQDRIGRWIKRYPQIQAELGHTLATSDVVEEVFLNAFERFEGRSHHVSPGDWLESLIDPSVQAILQSPDAEFERISYAKSLV
ncbi:MAG: HPF/RaiA family ribosome-associated protein [Rubripirellula sp.]